MFESTDILSERAKQALQNAAQSAAEHGKRYLDTEHLLIGIMDDEVIQRIFAKLNQPLDEVKEFILKKLTNGTYKELRIDITPRAKQVIDLSFQEARLMKHGYIGTEHVFLGLIREGEGLAFQTLKYFNITYEKAKKAVEQVIGEGETEQKEKSTTPILDKYARDLTKLAIEGRIDPVIGRAKEVSRIIQVLSRRKKNNPVLIGDPGVGKTAIVEGLALRISQDAVPDVLSNKRVMALDLGLLMAGAKFRGEFEERATKIIQEVEKNGRTIILFIDELHTIVGTGNQEGGLDLSNILKPPLARGDIQVIGATTLSEYQKYIEKDGALERRFQPVLVSEPTVEQTVEILKGIRDKYESHHKIQISDEALISAAELSEKYISDRFLPDKAIDIVDEAASKLRLETLSEPDEIRNLKHDIKILEQERESLTRVQKFEEAAKLKVNIDKKTKELEPLIKEWLQNRGTGTPVLTIDDIAGVVSQVTGIPVTQLKVEERQKLLALETDIHSRLVGQDEAVKAVSEAVRRARAGLKNPNRPIASFIFLGPTGVGKTELAKSLASILFGSENSMIRVDMSEYSEKFNVSRLIGSPPGYVGYDEGGQLTEKVRRNPYCLILLDEIEKAHPDVFNTLLQILEDGRLTDGKGRIVDFKNTIIIATSNLGADIIMDYKKEGRVRDYVGFNTTEKKKKKQSPWEQVKEQVLIEVQKFFKPEFLNRIDEIIIFEGLTRDQVRDVIKLELNKVSRILKSQKINVKFDEKIINMILEKGYSETYGAREIRRVIQKEIENPLSEMLLSNKLESKKEYTISYEKENIKIK